MAGPRLHQRDNKQIKTMKTARTKNLIAAALVGALAFTTTVVRADDPLPSWNVYCAGRRLGMGGSLTPIVWPEQSDVSAFEDDGSIESLVFRTASTVCLSTLKSGFPASKPR
jgi:hypothetical protein